MKELIEIIKTGVLKDLQEAIKLKSFDINSTDDDDTTLLHYAAGEGQEDMVRWLLSQGAIVRPEKYDAHPQDYAEMYARKTKPEITDRIVLLLDQAQAAQKIQLALLQTSAQNPDVSGSEDTVAPKMLGVDEKSAIEEIRIQKETLPEEFQRLIMQIPEKPWLDIPKTKNLKFMSDPKFSSLMNKIQEYHALNKTNKKVLANRIILLKEIYKEMQELSVAFPMLCQTAEFAELKRSVFGKSLYLDKIARRELNKNWFLHFMFGGFTKDGYHLRTIRRDYCGHEMIMTRITSEKSVEHHNATPYLDPCLRAGFKGTTVVQNNQCFAELYEAWLIELKSAKDDNFPSFYMWLEDKDHLTNTFIPDCRRQAIELLELRKCRVINGRVQLERLAINLNFDGHVSVNAMGELFISSIKDWTNTPNHPHIHFGFEPVIFAGHMKVTEGKIVFIHNFSGHYQLGPSYFRQFLNMMQKLDCLDPACKLQVFYTDKAGNCICVEKTIQTIDFQEIIAKHHYAIKTKNPMATEPMKSFVTISEIMFDLKKAATKLEKEKVEAAATNPLAGAANGVLAAANFVASTVSPMSTATNSAANNGTSAKVCTQGKKPNKFSVEKKVEIAGGKFLLMLKKSKKPQIKEVAPQKNNSKQPSH